MDLSKSLSELEALINKMSREEMLQRMVDAGFKKMEIMEKTSVSIDFNTCYEINSNDYNFDEFGLIQASNADNLKDAA